MLLLGGWLVAVGVVGLMGITSGNVITLMHIVAIAAGAMLLLGR